MMDDPRFRVLFYDLEKAAGEVVRFGRVEEHLGGSGLAAALYRSFGVLEEDAFDPRQPLVFSIGPLTGYFPLMSKVVLGFKSPYHQQYAEAHAGGRLALAMRFCGYDALVITGVAKKPSCLIIGSHRLGLEDVHYLWGQDVFSTGKLLRRIHGRGHGHRSILRIGPAGENRVPYAAINVDTYRHFGRLGSGAVMGSKNLKGIVVLGETDKGFPEGKAYPGLYREIYKAFTESDAMQKYHDLGTPENLSVLNRKKALPWYNLKATSDERIESISGERFAEQLLLRQTACAGCPVGCIHVGILRQMFAKDHEYLYRQVSYDYEPVFAAGTMLGVTNASEVLTLIEEIDKAGLDVMSAGVALAWATEAFEKEIVTRSETLADLQFGNTENYVHAIRHLSLRSNDFYFLLGNGAKAAAERYGGGDFACVLGQEMAGYATGEVFFVSQAYGFRHSHLDSGGYAYDQKETKKEIESAVAFLLTEECRRVELTCMVSCLFARKIYSSDRLQQALSSVGLAEGSENLSALAKRVQKERWRLKFDTGYDPSRIEIPKRFKDVVTEKGPIDEAFLTGIAEAYQAAILKLVDSDD